jgi:hypothetical protein
MHSSTTALKLLQYFYLVSTITFNSFSTDDASAITDTVTVSACVHPTAEPFRIGGS